MIYHRPIHRGKRTTLSYVAFTDTKRLNGDIAKNQAARNPESMVFDAKTPTGRESADPIVQSDIKLRPLTVASDASDEPMIVVNYHSEEKKSSYRKRSA